MKRSVQVRLVVQPVIALGPGGRLAQTLSLRNSGSSGWSGRTSAATSWIGRRRLGGGSGLESGIDPDQTATLTLTRKG